MPSPYGNGMNFCVPHKIYILKFNSQSGDIRRQGHMAGALGHNRASKLGKVMMVWGEINNVVLPVQRIYLNFFKVL